MAISWTYDVTIGCGRTTKHRPAVVQRLSVTYKSFL